MLWAASMMWGYVVSGIDGEVGMISDLLFDDTNWKMRWLVVRTGDWFPNHDVLLPVAVWRYPDPARHQFGVNLTVQQIRNSPHVEADLPVSRQGEAYSPRHRATSGPRIGYAALSMSKPNDPHLRSIDAVVGHRVHAIDGLIGHVEDLLIYDVNWSVRFIKVDTRNWGPACRVLLPPRLVRKIDWAGRAVHLDVGRRAVENRSLYDPAVGNDVADEELFLACNDIRWVKE